jgi:limonene-1,2-epoxide hydrolase
MLQDTTTVGQRLVQLLSEIGTRKEAALEDAAELFAETLHFQDPLQQLAGRDKFIKMNRRLFERSRKLEFIVLGLCEDDEQVYCSWQMILQPKFGPQLTIEGATHAKHDGRQIHEHRDYWDLLSSFVQTMPMASMVYKMLVSKLA